MFDKKEYLRAITSFFYFRTEKSAVGTTKKIPDARGDSMVNERKIQERFKKLRPKKITV